jgi:Fur family ferric uptake transcriptional regulator
MTAPSPGQRATSQGAAVRAALEAHDGFRSAQDVHAALREDGSKVGLSTVYRHLQALTDAGLVDVIHNPDGETTYRFCGDKGDRHHHHLVCRSCGRAVEVEGAAVERWAADVARRAGYVEVDHTVEVFGLCPACATARPRVV